MSVKWIKLDINMFNDEKIKLIRTLPDGNSIVLLWIQLLLAAGKTNDHGLVYLGDGITYTDEMLATITGFSNSMVRSGIKTLKDFGMISIDENGFIAITNWDKYQNIEGMDKIREQNRIRKRKQREREKQAEIEADSKSHVTSRDSHATDIDKERRKKNKNKNKNKNREIYSRVVSYLNEKAGRNYRPNTQKTKSLIDARLNEGFELEDFKTVIDKKTAEWLGDEKMDRYLRPETLFGPKFEGYLNEKPKQQFSKQQQKEEQPKDPYDDGNDIMDELNEYYRKLERQEANG